MKLHQDTFGSSELSEDITTSYLLGINQSPESVSILFALLCDKLYSDKIGSIVREIVTNAIDANIENNKSKELVTVKLYKGLKDESGYFSVKDKGPGISPEDIPNTYNLLSSSKRNSNSQTGCYGLGAKTPISYSDSFSVITIVNNIKYYYEIYRGNSNLEASLLHQEETLEENGTEIKIPINNKDYDEFIRAIQLQLKYFDNIDYDISNYIDLNLFKIYKGKHWIYRCNLDNKGLPVEKVSYNNSLDICHGKVRYPIQWSSLGLDYYDSSSFTFNRCNFALYFDIGELDITPSREAIEYTEKSKKAIKEKIELVIKELKEVRTNEINLNTLKEYFSYSEDYIKINPEVSLCIRNFISSSKVNVYYLPFKQHKLNLKDKEFSLLIEKSLEINFLSILRISLTVGLKEKKNIIKSNFSIYNLENYKKENRTIIYVKNKINPKKSKYILDKYENVAYLKDNGHYLSSLGLENKIDNLNYLKLKELLIDILKQEYNLLIYDDIEIDEEWEIQYKKELKEAKLKIEEEKTNLNSSLNLNKQISAYLYTYKGNIKKSLNNYSIKELKKQRKKIFYFFKEDISLAKNILRALNCDKFIFLEIKKREASLFNFKRAYSIHDFGKVNAKYIQRLFALKELEEFLNIPDDLYKNSKAFFKDILELIPEWNLFPDGLLEFSYPRNNYILLECFPQYKNPKYITLKGLTYNIKDLGNAIKEVIEGLWLLKDHRIPDYKDKKWVNLLREYIELKDITFKPKNYL